MSDNFFTRWSQGIESEREFWSRWLDTKGLDWPEDYANRTAPTHDLDPAWLGELLFETRGADDGGRARFRILDVGSGPLSKIGNRLPGADLEVVAADPLALVYADLLREHGVEPRVRTEFAPAEDLSAFFAPSSFDLVHCCNALDHAFDPMRGIVELLRVVRVGGTVVLRHEVNEGARGGYLGLHQHNFELADGRLVLWNDAARRVVDEHLPVAVEMVTAMEGQMVMSRIVKRAEFADLDDTARRDRRVQEIYRQVMATLTGRG